MALFKGKIATVLAVWHAGNNETPNDQGCGHYGRIGIEGASLGQLANIETTVLGAGDCTGHTGEVALCFKVQGSNEWHDATGGFWSADWSEE